MTLIVLLICVIALIGFFRRYDIRFDAHHRYEEEDTTFFHWVAGWFSGFDNGPNDLYLLQGTFSDPNDKQFLNYLRELDSEAKFLYSSQYHDFRIQMAWLPKTEEVVCLGNEIKLVRALSQKNEWGDSFSTNKRVLLPIKIFSAWTRTRWTFKSENHSKSLGIAGTVPADELLARSFQIQFKGQGRSGSVVVGYDHSSQQWRMFDREYEEEKEINSWFETYVNPLPKPY